MNQTDREKMREAARISAEVASQRSGSYRPTIRDPAIADAFDAAMQSIGRPERAWRGNNPENADPSVACACGHERKHHVTTKYGEPCFLVGCLCNGFHADMIVTASFKALRARIEAKIRVEALALCEGQPS